MPLYMDIHHMPGDVRIEDAAKAHEADLQAQRRHAVRYLRYWVSEADAKLFCLVEAPSADAAHAVHREAHGMVADDIYEVQEGA
jgi:uncharacterized protein DUF4242